MLKNSFNRTGHKLIRHKYLRHKYLRHKYLMFLCTYVSAVLCFCVPCRAQGFSEGNARGDIKRSEPEKLFSPSVGQKFYTIAYEIANSETIIGPEVEEAIVFLRATMNLDGRAKYVLPVLIKLAWEHPEQDHSELVSGLLTNYVDGKADLEVIRKAISYLLGRLNSREQRQKTLEEMLKNLGRKNKVLGSELATELGLLMAEKPDIQAAESYLMQAYNDNKYNTPALEKLLELVPKHIGPAMRLEHLRLRLRENPFDMAAAMAFAQYADKLQLYETAGGAYEYCADLFRFAYPSKALPAYIYLPWSISCYNSQRSRPKCLQIASALAQKGHFDLLLETIAGRAAAKLDNKQSTSGGLPVQAKQILKAAEDKAVELAISKHQTKAENKKSKIENCQSLAWFYCFGLPDPNKALQWANRAYSSEPNSTDAAGILAYSLVMNGQDELAKSLIDNYAHTQIADLTLARIQLAKKQKKAAIETLKSAIARDPGSLAAENARELLARQGGKYIPPIDPNIVLTAMKDSFGEKVVPRFLSPKKIISVQLNLQGGKFYYGSDIDGAVIITNNSAEPFVVSDESFFKGNIRIDANVSGGLEKKIPNLVTMKVRPATAVEPGRSIITAVRLATGRLEQILLTYPQASLNIEFTVYLDPVTTAEGRPSNGLSWIKPAKVVINRPGVELSGAYLQNRLNSLSKGQTGQKIATAQLFTGLLMEEEAMANREPLYKFKYADWMPALLKSALVQTIADDDWTVKAHTMAGMVSLPLDYELTNAVAKNLNDTHWPVRMMAIFLLAKSGGNNFGRVLDWTAKYDPSKYVRQMAIALGGREPQQQKQANPAGHQRPPARPVIPPKAGKPAHRI